MKENQIIFLSKLQS